MPVAFPSACRQVVRRSLGALLPRQWLLISGPRAARKICLTFDDGPDPEHTPRLLDVLGELEVRATFFVIGERVQRHPSLLRRLAAEDHELGHHSYFHTEPHHTSAAQVLREIEATTKVIEDVLGQSPRLFRPPHGKLTAAKLWSLRQAGLTVVLWNVDPKDWACASAEELQRQLDQRPARGGDIILFHDNRRHAADVVPALVRTARSRDLDFVTISELIS